MATTVLFDDGGGNTLSLPAPTTSKADVRYPQIVDRTWGGGIKRADLGDGTDWTQVEVTWDILTETEYSDLETFITSTLSWSETSFSYTDHHGTTHTDMHYESGLEDWEQIAYDQWTGSLVLVKDMSA